MDHQAKCFVELGRFALRRQDFASDIFQRTVRDVQKCLKSVFFAVLMLSAASV